MRTDHQLNRPKTPPPTTRKYELMKRIGVSQDTMMEIGRTRRVAKWRIIGEWIDTINAVYTGNVPQVLTGIGAWNVPPTLTDDSGRTMLEIARQRWRETDLAKYEIIIRILMKETIKTIPKETT